MNDMDSYVSVFMSNKMNSYYRYDDVRKNQRDLPLTQWL